MKKEPAGSFFVLLQNMMVGVLACNHNFRDSDKKNFIFSNI
jgi:hypothetical protein